VPRRHRARTAAVALLGDDTDLASAVATQREKIAAVVAQIAAGNEDAAAEMFVDGIAVGLGDGRACLRPPAGLS
jgi:hypothetical protein